MKNNEAEALLLNDKSLEDLINMKIEKEFMANMRKSKEKPGAKQYTIFSELPKDKIFSQYSVYRYFNRNTGCETFINGIQAEALIGVQNHIRAKMLSGELNAFTTDDAYIKFERAEF